MGCQVCKRRRLLARRRVLSVAHALVFGITVQRHVFFYEGTMNHAMGIHSRVLIIAWALLPGVERTARGRQARRRPMNCGNARWASHLLFLLLFLVIHVLLPIPVPAARALPHAGACGTAKSGGPKPGGPTGACARGSGYVLHGTPLALCLAPWASRGHGGLV